MKYSRKKAKSFSSTTPSSTDVTALVLSQSDLLCERNIWQSGSPAMWRYISAQYSLTVLFLRLFAHHNPTHWQKRILQGLIPSLWLLPLSGPLYLEAKFQTVSCVLSFCSVIIRCLPVEDVCATCGQCHCAANFLSFAQLAKSKV
jgi:hypothetical protein